MQKVTINNIAPGAVVAKPIYNDNGIMLAPNGMILHEQSIQKLLDLGVSEVHVVYPEQETTRILELYEEAPHIDDIIYYKTRIQAQKLIQKAMDRMLPENSINMEKISQMVDEIIEQLLSAKDIILTLSRLRSIDDYTYEHSVNVCVVSLVIGMDLNLDKSILKQLGIGALLHDVGKVSISEEILKKPAKLTHEEFNEVKSHTDIGYQILIKSGVSEEAAQIALYHHEKFDGSGYNRMLKGQDIPLLSRIVTVADSYDAMSNDRVYRRRIAPDKVYKEIAILGGQHFDYEITERFLRRIDLFPIGTGVVLNTNHKGVVIAQNKLLPQSPIIRIFKDESDSRNITINTDFVDVNLAKTRYLFIKETF